MNVILQGPQGSGKGTQAELLVKKFDFNYFEAGKILRSIAKSDNEYASVIKTAMEKGNLVSDEYLRLIAWDYINKQDRSKGYLFDGYPRSLYQYEHLKDMLTKFGQKIDAVINIEISEAETIRRLEKRRTCKQCAHVQIEGLVCEVCGGEVFQRDDDKPEGIKRRLQIYRGQTHLVFERALQEGIGYQVNGDQTIAKVNEDILTILLPLDYA